MDSGTSAIKLTHHLHKTWTEEKTSKAAYHGHVDIVWIAGIVIRTACCFGRLGVACA